MKALLTLLALLCAPYAWAQDLQPPTPAPVVEMKQDADVIRVVVNGTEVMSVNRQTGEVKLAANLSEAEKARLNVLATEIKRAL